MRTSRVIVLATTVLGICLMMVVLDIRTASAQNTQSVEGVWEVISINMPDLQSNVGRKISIVRKDGGYEVLWADGGTPVTFSGNETRIECTRLESLVEPGDSHGAGSPIPNSVEREVSGIKVPINISYMLSSDGLFLRMQRDGRWVYWDNKGRYTHYEVKQGFYTVAFKRVSGPVKVESRGDRTSAVAQVESRGEFYVLTNDGRKLSGKDANQIPFEEGTKVITGSSGHVRMKLPDDTTFTIGPNSDIVIDSFIYDPDNTPKKVIANMSKGVFRWVTGKTKPLQDTEMKVKLPVMAVGIRGTDFEATVKPDNSGSVVLHFGQLEITENKTGFKFIMDAGYKVTFNANGTVSRPMKAE